MHVCVSTVKVDLWLAINQHVYQYLFLGAFFLFFIFLFELVYVLISSNPHKV